MLGKGGFGEVYLCNYQGIEVAVKYMSIEINNPEIQHEIFLLSRCNSKFVVKLIGYCHEQNNSAIVLEYLPRGDLSTFLSKHKSTPLVNRYQIGLDVVCGISYLHRNGIIHADIKSPNVLLDEELRGKITDFGVSKYKQSSESTTIGIAKAGSYRWMAPELEENDNSKTTKLSDIFSLGMVLWELMSFVIPFANITVPSRKYYEITRSEKKEVIPPSTPAVFAQIINACWNNIPEQRPSLDYILENLALEFSNIQREAVQ
uniref:Protein kinase domain-containing protein n=1 Tax=Arcella intermedia TaxID=1963864 RepID=A0A6B2LDJ8_9EUKA|eukprot:TRINITY_DN7208_c0_g1_i1.p1 TRINITY_DN7208_c0_g1~~TRINITY_DN7208_c0_g1_i1.p1  ORF type:complete len:260 (+),score=70.27 TRINITY_DN7208_c0_g1_i1:115-894(+)